MSRSYKKQPCSKDPNDQYIKRLSNKRLRQKLKNPEVEFQNSSYKKDTNSWDISDYSFLYTWEDFWNFSVKLWEQFDKDRGVPFPDEKKEYAKWRKWYQAK